MAMEKTVKPEEVGASSELLERLDRLVERDISQGLAYGATILAARHGKVFYRKAFGTTDDIKAGGRPSREDDIYFMMSLSKCVLATTVLRSIEKGHFAFDTRVSDVFPEFGAWGKENITVFQLLNHRVNLYIGMGTPAGIDMFNVEEVAKWACTLEYDNDVANRVYYQPFVPYSVLAYLVTMFDEKGRSYKQIVEEDIFRPLGMMDSSVSINPSNPRRVPLCYVGGAANSEFCNVVNSAPETAEYPAGNVYSTVDDMFRFGEMIRNHGTYNGARILSPAMVKYAVKNHTGDAPNETFMCRTKMIGMNEYAPMNYTLLGGYMRGDADDYTGCGYLASPNTYYALGGGSTLMSVDPERELTWVHISAGLIFGEMHRVRMGRIGDLITGSLLD